MNTTVEFLTAADWSWHVLALMVVNGLLIYHGVRLTIRVARAAPPVDDIVGNANRKASVHPVPPR